MSPNSKIETEDTAGSHATNKRLRVTSLARGLAILRCFSAERPQLGTTEIARMTGLAQPTVWRLTHTLRKLGYLVEADRDRLSLGVPVLAFGYTGLAGMALPTLALPSMQNIADETGGMVSLGAREGNEIVYLQRCQGPSIVFSDFRVGSRAPLVISPTGWAYLVCMSEAERAACIAAFAAEGGAVPAGLAEALERAAAEFATSGYVRSLGIMHPQLNAVSVSLRDAANEVGAALTCGGIASVFPPGRLATVGVQLREIADMLAVAL